MRPRDGASYHDRYRAIAGASAFDPARMGGERVFEVRHAMVLEEEHAAA